MDTAAPFGVSDETCSLADSAYELISSTDGESQDGRGTDSVADSLDVYPRADDVHSLNGNDAAYDDDDVDEESASENDDANHEPICTPASTSTPSNSRLYPGRHGSNEDAVNCRSSQTDSIQYAEHVLGSPSTQSLSNLEYDKSGDGNGPTPLVHSIEFSESDICLDKVSVKHTIRDFGDAESAAIAGALNMTDPPRRLAATIRQTMSHYCLSTREPLKVLYVGSEAGYNDIMYKISSALLASASHNRSSPGSEHHSPTPSIYNIMPISSFGSSKVPEIDEIQLMGVSDYYIKVERCIEADETVSEGEASPNEMVYSIKLDNEETYASVFSPHGSAVRPQWSLPHVAVFYVSGNDDDRAEKTRNAAWEFMTRHAVPSIFISHAQSFSQPTGTGRWRDFVDQAAVHLCLESRDPERLIIPERLPIDLVSFLNIDARQMNRNLAYLTGLHEPSKAMTNDSVGKLQKEGYRAGAVTAVRFLCRGNYFRTKLSRTVDEISGQLGAGRLFTMVVAAIGALMWFYILLYIPFISPSFTGQQSVVAATVSASTVSSLTDTATSSVLSTSSVATTSTSTCFAPSLTPTVTISLTSTTTVKLQVSESSSSAVQFGGNHEILVKVPSGTKTTWLAKGAIDIDVWRGQELLKSRLSTTDEGIIIEINKKDAYGVMNVSIVTTRRPKINETFAVDFGKPTMLRVLEIGAKTWLDSARTAANIWLDAAMRAEGAVHPYIDHVVDLLPNADDVLQGATMAATSMADVVDSMKHAGQAAYDTASRATQDLKGQMSASLEGAVDSAKRDARAVLDRGLLPLDHARGSLQLAVLRAQIASKLWWMQVNGQRAKHADYEAKAAVFLRESEKALKANAKTGAQSGTGDRNSHQGCQMEKYRWCHSFGSRLWKKTSASEPGSSWKFLRRGREVRG
ncbi:hypothetical protein CMQ_7223 [Grosmannia clavigera kw1407]|uniref:Uncharacterized protein n=1 Tax=Grosmannia clavigera (strain kw1407 / UAMH 11150) TaxID=655863 RepID=F0XPV9_GROCL|nr:uncharacterized protein CMQ_7223 [Grosmannia clavigera kw1407]EFX00221.1 hypothetical protein CMQ_7223 [Grosmannia clavigera kw1407]